MQKVGFLCNCTWTVEVRNSNIPLATCHTSNQWLMCGFSSRMYFFTELWRSVTKSVTVMSLVSITHSRPLFKPSSSMAWELPTSLLCNAKDIHVHECTVHKHDKLSDYFCTKYVHHDKVDLAHNVTVLQLNIL